MSQSLYLIDASVYLFRASSAAPEVVGGQGQRQRADAVLGYGPFFCELLERRRPAFVTAAFDGTLSSSFRNDLYGPYQTHRPPAPPDLKRQFRRCRELSVARIQPLQVLASTVAEAG